MGKISYPPWDTKYHFTVTVKLEGCAETRSVRGVASYKKDSPPRENQARLEHNLQKAARDALHNAQKTATYNWLLHPADQLLFEKLLEEREPVMLKEGVDTEEYDCNLCDRHLLGHEVVWYKVQQGRAALCKACWRETEARKELRRGQEE